MAASMTASRVGLTCPRLACGPRFHVALLAPRGLAVGTGRHPVEDVGVIRHSSLGLALGRARNHRAMEWGWGGLRRVRLGCGRLPATRTQALREERDLGLFVACSSGQVWPSSAAGTALVHGPREGGRRNRADPVQVCPVVA